MPTANSTTLNPWLLAVGVPITAEDLETVEELLNYAAGLGVAQSHVCAVTGPSGWGSDGSEVGTLWIRFLTGSGFVTRLRFLTFIDPDAQEVEVRSVCDMPASNEGEVRITVGGATPVVHSHTASGESTDDSTIATADTGTGEQWVTVEIDHTVGSSNAASLRRVRVRNAAIPAANLPAPVAE
ncbi:MAG: hypothetical protein RMA76_38110 [Deltaproteobacteria bacterium]|jgi:hypothetical protein